MTASAPAPVWVGVATAATVACRVPIHPPVALFSPASSSASRLDGAAAVTPFAAGMAATAPETTRPPVSRPTPHSSAIAAAEARRTNAGSDMALLLLAKRGWIRLVGDQTLTGRKRHFLALQDNRPFKPGSDNFLLVLSDYGHACN